MGRLREVGMSNDGLHARQRKGARGVDALDDRVGVGAAKNTAVEHARKVNIGAVLGPARDLVSAVRPHGPCAYDLVFLCSDHSLFLSMRRPQIRNQWLSV